MIKDIISLDIVGFELRKIVPTLDNAKTIFNTIEKNRSHLYFMEWINDINSADKMLDIMNNNGRNIVFGIYKNESYIGEFIVSPNYNTCICILGFWIDKDFARKGIISASLRVLEKELKLDGFNSAQLEIKTENKSSIECAKRNGYELVSTERYETGESIQLYDIFVKKF